MAEPQEVQDFREYNPIHYDQKVLLSLLNAQISEKRSSQPYILLEGLFNNRQLEDEQDQLSHRYMDELFSLEKALGEVAGVCCLQFNLEHLDYKISSWEEFSVKEESKVEKPA